ncbi:MAG: SBBP repeat-containing protein [Thermodesulfobacteriota bacterium]|nr:SBBP repeat-containing protein [Thermodesulfobacteriota bacterium]
MVRKGIISSIVVFALFILMTGPGFAQEWVARQDGGGSGYDVAVGMAVDVRGNIYVTGYINGGDYTDVLTVSYDSEGNKRWVRIYDAVGVWDAPYAITVDGRCNVFITGFSVGGLGNYCTISYDSDGNERWVQRYDGAGSWGAGYAIAVDFSDNVYVTGDAYCTISYDRDGSERWVQRYDGPGNGWDTATAIAVDVSGNVYVTGINDGDGTDDDYCTISYDSDGNERWVQRYNGPGDGSDEATAIAVDVSGNVYVTGKSYGGESSGNAYCTISYDRDGNERWVQRYDGPGNGWDTATAIAVDVSGNVYITGKREGDWTGYDYCTISYDSDGNERWVQRYNGPGFGSDEATAIAVDVSGNVYVTGNSRGVGTFDDYCTVSYDSDGNERWVQRYDGPGNVGDGATAIAVDFNGNIYVTGERFSDYCTIKYVGNPVKTLLEKAITTIDDLDDDDFKSGLLRGILLKRINSALSTYEKGFTNIALVQLKYDVIEKMDGCAKRGEPDTGLILYENDWLITCDAQNNLYPLIADVIDILDSL